MPTTPKIEQVKCNNGQYQPDGAQSQCLTASPGHYVLDDGAAHTVQTPCGDGKYQKRRRE